MSPEAIEVLKSSIETIKEELKTPYPTPPVGTPVVWYRKAEVKPGAEIAAVVTKVEDSGKISVTAFPPYSVPEATRRGVLHVSNPVHKKRANAVSVNCGSWDYPKGVNTPKAHFALHTEKLNAKLANLELELQKATAPETEKAKT